MRLGNAKHVFGGLVVLTAALVLALAPSADAGKSKEGQQKLNLSPRYMKKIELGRRLFYDKAISQSGTQACVDCHDPEYGFSDKQQFSMDERGLTPRHSQPIIDTHDNPSTHWDGEFDTVEDAVEARIGRPLVQKYYGVDMPVAPTTPSRSNPSRARPSTRPPTTGRGPIAGGSPTSPLPPPVPIPNRRRGMAGSTTPLDTRVADSLNNTKRYAEGFLAAFGSRQVTVEKIADAMAAYCHSIQSTEAPFDRYMKGDEDAISASAKRGLKLFKGEAGCAQCHTMKGDHPLFTDYKFHNTGIAWLGRVEDNRGQDMGRKRFTGSDEDEGAFKTMTLRDLSRRGPFMHDGRFKSLEAVVRYYKRGGSQDPKIDERLTGFDFGSKAANEQAIKDIVAFLETLTGDERTGLAKDAWTVRPKKQRLRFVSSNGKILKGLPVTIEPCGDYILGEDEKWDAITRDERVARDTLELTVERSDGWISYKPLMWTHAQVRIDGGLVTAAIPLLPDTVKNAKIQVPVEGKLVLDIIATKEAFTPELLMAGKSQKAASSFVAPVARRGGAPVTVQQPTLMKLRRKSLTRLGGKVIARYEGWVPTGFQDSKLYLQTVQGFSANDGETLAFKATPGKKDPTRLDLTGTLSGKK